MKGKDTLSTTFDKSKDDETCLLTGIHTFD